MLGVSVIVTTYNWPLALNHVLQALNSQTYSHFEVIIADDGSREETTLLIQQWQKKARFSLIHCWQPDEGFRAAMARNRAAAQARYDYLIFLDGDCVPLPHFVERHAKLAEPGWFVAGNRILLNQHFTQEIFKQDLAIENWPWLQWYQAFIRRQCNRFLPFLFLPLGGVRKVAPKKWQGAKTCNLAMWRQDFIGVNGLDEDYQGWGFEDSDLVLRLQRAHIYRKSGKYAVPVLHLWHPSEDKAAIQKNAQRLQQTLQSNHIKAIKGINQYLLSCS